MTNSSEEEYSLASAYAPSSVRALEGHGMMSLARGLGVSVLSDFSTASATLPTLIMAGLGLVSAPAPRPEPSNVALKGVDPLLKHGGVHQYCVDITRNPAVHNGINSKFVRDVAYTGGWLGLWGRAGRVFVGPWTPSYCRQLHFCTLARYF